MTQIIRSVDLSPGLYVVATPIGNLRDITLRALDTLAAADVVYAEDTRQTRRLFEAYGLKTPLRTYHDHNGAAMRPQILEDIESGKSVALVSDAGTPLISDPGFKLVREVAEAGYKVIPLPGASALTTALSVAGLPTDTFTFAGFLPPKSKQRQERLSDFMGQRTTLVFYETGPRIADAVTDIVHVYGDVEIVMARELTKLFETIHRSSAITFADWLAAEPTPKGEIVLMIALTGEETDGRENEQSVEDFLLEQLKTKGAKDAAGEAARKFSKNKRELYALAVTLQKHDT